MTTSPTSAAGTTPPLWMWAWHLDAVTAGLSVPLNSGAAEGDITKIKLLKRRHYGQGRLRPTPKTHPSRTLTGRFTEGAEGPAHDPQPVRGIRGRGGRLQGRQGPQPPDDPAHGRRRDLEQRRDCRIVRSVR
ncbi:transposase [Streptomyces sp. TYQ1024]|nr:transposase [Streptomyces sp. TYQ1024]